MNLNFKSVVEILLQSGAAISNIFLIARTLGLPMETVEIVIKASPFGMFFFLFSFALSVSNGYVPALLATLLYFGLEYDNLMKKIVIEKKGNSNIQATKRILWNTPTSMV
jgi:hypothetical protein